MTNALENVNGQRHKIIKRGPFLNDDAVFEWVEDLQRERIHARSASNPLWTLKNPTQLEIALLHALAPCPPNRAWPTLNPVLTHSDSLLFSHAPVFAPEPI
jgi:hypothetical protein